MLRIPLTGNYLETVGRPFGLGGSGGLAVFSRINACGQQLAGLIAALPGVLEAHFGVSAKRQQSFPALKPVLEPPPPAPGRSDQEEHSFFVGQLEPLWTRLGILDCGISQRHFGGNSHSDTICYP